MLMDQPSARSRIMAKVSVILMADTESHADLGRALNALELVKEAVEAGDEAEIVFDGAGVRWIPELSNPEHKLNKIFEKVRDQVSGACELCSSAFGVKQEVRESGVALLSEYDGHPSLRRRIADGYEVVTF
jgi:hypothetical protein